MSKQTYDNVPIEELVALFENIGVEQDKLLYSGETAKYNRLYKTYRAVRNALKAKPGDGRRALEPQLSHPNLRVRLNAATQFLVFDRERAIAVIEDIRVKGRFNHNAVDAGFTISNMEKGIFVPD